MPLPQTKPGLKTALKGKLPPPKTPAKPMAKPPVKTAAKAPVGARPNAGKPAPRTGPSYDDMANEAFEGVKSAKVYADSNYERAGHYIERIDQVLLKKNRSGQTNLCIEKTILAVIAEDPQQGNAHRVGEEIGDLVPNHGSRKDYFLPTVKKFTATVLECDPEAIDLDDCKKIADPKKQPLSGFVVECFNINKVGVKSGKDYTKIQYRRRVPFGELRNYLDAETIEFFYPDGSLDALIEQEGGEPQAQAEEAPAGETEEQASETEEQPEEGADEEEPAVEEEMAQE